jgi:hypothetical protein
MQALMPLRRTASVIAANGGGHFLSIGTHVLKSAPFQGL